jgi:hypothetical protein
MLLWNKLNIFLLVLKVVLVETQHDSVCWKTSFVCFYV